MDLSGAMTPWDATVMLLDAWQQTGTHHPLTADRASFDQWQDRSEFYASALRRLQVRRLLSGAARELLEASDNPVDLFSAAWAIDEVLHSTFTPAWLGDGEIQPHPGDLVPLPDWTPVRDTSPDLLPLRWRTEPGEGDLPHARRWATTGFDVVFDGRHRRQVDRLASADRVATIALNASMDEFATNGGFPIEVQDLDLQRDRVHHGFALAVEDSADLIVFPELSVPRQVVEELAVTVAQDGRRFVVAGSSHDVTDGTRRNVARLILPTGEIIEWAKRVRFDTRRFREEIEPDTGPLRVLVGSEVRLAVGICKDLLDTSVLDAVEAAGVNLAVVPSLSRSLALHDIRSQQLAANARTTTIVSNGPLDVNGRMPASMLVTLPVEDPRRVRQGRHTSVPQALTWELSPPPLTMT